jgi:hypothetical protein
VYREVFIYKIHKAKYVHKYCIVEFENKNFFVIHENILQCGFVLIMIMKIKYELLKIKPLHSESREEQVI